MTIHRWVLVAGLLLPLGLAACSKTEPAPPAVDSGVFGQIELTALTGDYDYDSPDSSRTTSFPFPDDIATFRELRLVVSGTWSLGTMEITNNFGVSDTVDFNVSLTVHLGTADVSVDYFEAVVIPPQGDFGNLDDIFFACCPRRVLDPELLLAAEISARLSCVYTLPPNARVLTAPQGIITEVLVEAVDAVRAEWPPGWMFP